MSENVFIAKDGPADRMYDFVRSHDGGVTLTVTKMGEATGMNYNLALKVLHALEAAGLITSRHLGKTLANRTKHYEAVAP